MSGSNYIVLRSIEILILKTLFIQLVLQQDIRNLKNANNLIIRLIGMGKMQFSSKFRFI